MNNNTLQNLAGKIDDIVDRIDTVSASELLKELAQLSSEEKNAIGSEFDKILAKLKIVNFPSLSDKEAANIVKNHLLLFSEIDVPFEQRLTARYAFHGTTEKNNQRKILKDAILENKELIGGIAIGQWLLEFDKRYSVDEREEQDIMNFFLINPNARKLNEKEKHALKKIVHTYDTLLASRLVDLFDLVELSKIIKKNPQIITNQNNFSKQRQSNYLGNRARIKERNNLPEEQQKIERLTISEALKKYSDLGEQLITSEKIKLKSFPDLARPSIKNWLSDYTFNAGHEAHDSMKRGVYLFQNQNAKILNSEDRKKLTFILKAFDENSIVVVNTNLKQVVFPSIPKINTQNKPTNVPMSGRKEMDPLRQSQPPQRQEIPRSKPSAGANFYTSPASRQSISHNLKTNHNIQPLGNNSEQKLIRKPERMPYETDSKKIPARPSLSPAPGLNYQTKKVVQTDTPETSGKMVFSSPQRFSNETQRKPDEVPPAGPQPIMITPSGFRRELNKQTKPKGEATVKNVVNLKE